MPKQPTKLELMQAHMLYAPHDKDMEDLQSKISAAVAKKEARKLTPKNRPEDDLQIMCCQYLDMHPRIMYWATPNHLYGGKNKNNGAFMGYMAKQKRMGLKKGVADLIMFFDGKLVAAELKAGSNRIKENDDQDKFGKAIIHRGGFFAQVKSLNDLIILLKKAGYSR